MSKQLNINIMTLFLIKLALTDAMQDLSGFTLGRATSAKS
jgi:hypothetical protein